MGNSPEFTLRVGNATDPQTLDPQLLVDLQQIAIARGLFEGLVILDEETLEPIPAVAERWEISRDGCVYTFFLRQNLRWSDGKPLTATDFTFALQRILSPQLCSPAVELIFPIKNARAYYEGKVSWDAVGVCAIDEHRLQIVLQRPTPHFLSLLAHPAWSPLPQRVVEACGSITQRDSSWTRAGKMVSNGPYRLREWHVGNRVSLEKNPYYRDDLREAPARIIFYSIGDAITEQNAFDGGEIDITATIPPDRVDMLRRNDPESLSEVASLGVFYYMFQCEREPLSNIHLRRALSLALDRAELCRLLGRDVEFIAGNLVPPHAGVYVYAKKMVRDDVEEAKKELLLAGYADGSAVPPIVVSINTQQLIIAQAVQEMWRKNLGIRVELHSEEWKSFLLTRRVGNFDIARGGWIGDYNDPMAFLELFCVDATNNFSRWKNAKFSGLLDAAGQEANAKRRHELLQKAEEILLDEMPIIPIYFESNRHRISPRICQWKANLLDYHLWQNIRLR